MNTTGMLLLFSILLFFHYVAAALAKLTFAGIGPARAEYQRKLILSAALLTGLAAFYSGAATYYLDPSSANGGDGTEGAPYNEPTDFTLAANDTLYIRAASAIPDAVLSAQLSITGIDGVTVRAYGGGVCEPIFNIVSGCWIIDGGDARAYGILATAASNTAIYDGIVRNTTENAISWNNDVAVTESNFSVTRVLADNIGPGIVSPSGESQFNDGTCFFARSGPTTGLAVLTGLTYTDTLARNCGKHGYDTRWRVENVRHVRAWAITAGLSAAGHGFSAHPLFETFTSSGWSNVSGNIYTRDRSSNSNQERRIVETSTNTILAQNTGTPATPGANEWGVVAGGGGGACTNNATVGCLYVNVGGVLTGKTFLVKRFSHGPFYYFNTVSRDNRDSQNASEGHGYSMDDLSGPAYYFGALAEINQGHGFTTLRGEGVQWRGVISRGNRLSGVHFYNCSDCDPIHASAGSNGTRAFWDGGVTSIDVDIQDNVAVSDATRGFSVSAGTAGAAGFSSGTNYSWNNSTNSCTNVTCTEADPQLLGGNSPTTPDGYRPKSTSPLCDAALRAPPIAGTYYDGQRFGETPDIGALACAQ